MAVSIAAANHLVIVLLLLIGNVPSTLPTCDPSSEVCANGDDLTFPPRASSPSSVSVDTEPDQGGLTVYFVHIVGGFYKFAFPGGLPWSEIGSMLQVFMGTSPDPADQEDEGNTQYLMDESLSILQGNFGHYVVFTLIVVASLLFLLCCPIVVCCFCICRCCCNNCGGKKEQKKPTNCCFLALLIITSLGLVLTIVGGCLLVAVNAQITEDIPSEALEFSQDSVTTLTDWVKDVINEMYDNSVPIILDLIDVILTDMLSAGEQMFQPILDHINSSLYTEFAATDAAIADYNTEMDQMNLYLNNTYYDLSTQPQNMKEISLLITSIHDNLSAEAACLGDTDCNNAIAELAKHIINDGSVPAYVGYTDPPIASGFSASAVLDDTLSRAGDDLNNLAESQLNGTITEFRSLSNDLETELNGTRNDIVNDVDNMDLSMDTLESFQEDVEDYGPLRTGLGSLMMIPALIVFIVATIGLVAGLIGFDRLAEPHKRSNLSNCGGKWVCCGAIFAFLFVWIHVAGFIFPFLFLSTPTLVCEGLKSDEIITNTIDRPYFVDGSTEYYLADLILGNDSVPLTITSVLDGCRDGETAWTVFMVENSTKYDIDQYFDVSQVFNDLTTQFDDAESFDFSSFDIMGSGFQTQIDDIQANVATYKTNIDSLKTSYDAFVGDYYTQLATTQGAAPIAFAATPCDSASDCDSIEDIRTLLSGSPVAGNAVVTTAIADLSTVITNRDQMNSDKTDFHTHADNVKTELDNIDATLTPLETAVTATEADLDANGTAMLTNAIVAYATKLSDWFQDTIDYILDGFKDSVGRCKPFVDIYDAFLVNFCDYFFLELSGLCFASGVTGVGLITTMISATKLSKYFKKMNDPSAPKPKVGNVHSQVSSSDVKVSENGVKGANPPPVYQPPAAGNKGGGSVALGVAAGAAVASSAPAASAPPPAVAANPADKTFGNYQWDAKKDWEPVVTTHESAKSDTKRHLVLYCNIT